MKRIALIGLNYDTNLGDPIIYDSAKYLVENILREKNIKGYELVPIDMSGRLDFYSEYEYKSSAFVSSIYKILNILCKIFNKTTKNSKVINSYSQVFMWNVSEEKKKIKKFYLENIKKMDAIIFVGGGIIKYKYQQFNYYINEIIKVASSNNIPVMINAAGVEGFNEKDARCSLLKRALNNNTVKVITTRDDINILRNNYIYNKNIVLDQVADSAVWIANAYNVKKDEKSNVIGLGVIRSNIFKDNDIDFNEGDLLIFWKNIINNLEIQGKEWVIFTNGLQADYDFAITLMKYLGRENEINVKVIKKPNSAEELVNIISKFKGVIASRLHACIIAYSLNIPVVGLVWNDKLTMFGKCINKPERFILHNNFQGKYVVDVLNKSIKEGYNLEIRNYYKLSVKKYLERYIELLES